MFSRGETLIEKGLQGRDRHFRI